MSESTQPTKEPFTSPEKSNTNDTTLLGLVGAPFAAVGGMVDQVARKITGADKRLEKDKEESEET
ncbi:hypothetical protein K501DRAFT_283965 [Backusella circina FSU 941]|nr:hypothetical protein K501DRAFT_283965 [Backusella circina FSU 941]